MADDAPCAWFDRVRRVLRRQRRRSALGLGPRVVVAVSGGSDSVGLLRALHALAPEFGLTLSVAHLDHGARGEASQADARFVVELASHLGLPCDLGHWAPSRPSHFEADARQARYAWLVEVARTRDASAVAVGHTRDDQAETILHRIVRGTGPRGLAGMPSSRALTPEISLLRPLLDVTRAEIRGGLRALGQDWREDATNHDPKRTRARLRHEVLPRLAAEFNPRVVEALVRLGRLSGASGRMLEDLLKTRFEHIIILSEANLIVLRRGLLAESPRVERAELLRLVWRRAGWPERDMTARRWLRLTAGARIPDLALSLGGGVELRTTAETLRLTRGPAAVAQVPDPTMLRIPGAIAFGTLGIAACFVEEATPAQPDRFRDGGNDETIDRDRLDLDPTTPALIVRSSREGDRFEPLGLDGHGMSLTDFLRGRGVPRDRRPTIPLVCDRSGIVWVVGHRIAHRVRQTNATRRRLGLSCQPIANPSET